MATHTRDAHFRKITLEPSGRQFNCTPEQTLLEAGLTAGLALPYHCANGQCGKCCAKVTAGEIEQVRFHDFTLSAVQKINRECLMCSVAPRTDIVLQVVEATSAGDIALQSLSAKVCANDTLGDVLITQIRLARGRALRFSPGQFARLVYSDQSHIVLPIASCPCTAQVLEFHLPLLDHPNYRHAANLLSHTKRCRLTLEGPVPDPKLRKGAGFDPAKAQHGANLFVCVGIGFAVIQGIIEHLQNIEPENSTAQARPIGLIWLATDSVTHYRHNLCRAWADAFDEFSYQPLAATPTPDLTKPMASFLAHCAEQNWPQGSTQQSASKINIWIANAPHAATLDGQTINGIAAQLLTNNTTLAVSINLLS